MGGPGDLLPAEAAPRGGVDGDVRCATRPYREPFTLEPSHPRDYALFGSHLALFGNLLAVDADKDTGGVILFERAREGSWRELRHIATPAGEAYLVLSAEHLFVASASTVSIYAVATGDLVQQLGTRGRVAAMDADGETLAASAHGVRSTVHVWRRDGRKWREAQTIECPPEVRDPLFGNGLALRGETLVVGVPNYSGQEHQQGALFVYALRQGRWEHTQTLTAADGGENHFMGSSVALAEGVVAAEAGHGRGLAYVFARGHDGAWQQEARLQPEGATPPLHFASVTMPDAGTVVLSTSTAGSWVFCREVSGRWRQSQALMATNAGWRAFSSGDILAVPSANSAVDGTGLAGAVVLFER
jgi:hypothetical protein